MESPRCTKESGARASNGESEPKRKRSVSPCDGSATPEREFRGFLPIYDSPEPGTSKDRPSPNVNSRKDRRNPAGWDQHHYPIAMYYNPFMYPYHNPMDSEEDAASDMETPDPPTPGGETFALEVAPGRSLTSAAHTSTQGVSLQKHLMEVELLDEVGPPVNSSVADLVSKIWDKPVKDDIRQLYDSNKRPENIASLQKVELDDEVLNALHDKSKTRNLDFALKGINNALVKGASGITSIVNTAMTAGESSDIRQAVVDKGIEVLRIMAYGAQCTHSVRKEQIKPLLHADIRQKLCAKRTSVAEVNRSHCLFGGDVTSQVKKGEFMSLFLLPSFRVNVPYLFISFSFQPKRRKG